MNRQGNPDLTKPVGFDCSDRGAKESARRIKKTVKRAWGKLFAFSHAVVVLIDNEKGSLGEGLPG